MQSSSVSPNFSPHSDQRLRLDVHCDSRTRFGQNSEPPVRVPCAADRRELPAARRSLERQAKVVWRLPRQDEISQWLWIEATELVLMPTKREPPLTVLSRRDPHSLPAIWAVGTADSGNEFAVRGIAPRREIESCTMHSKTKDSWSQTRHIE